MQPRPRPLRELHLVKLAAGVVVECNFASAGIGERDHVADQVVAGRGFDVVAAIVEDAVADRDHPAPRDTSAKRKKCHK